MKFAGVRDLATFLAGSEETHEAFVEQLFHYLVKQPIRAFGPQQVADLRRSFADNRLQHPQADGGDVIAVGPALDQTRRLRASEGQ